MIIKKLYVAVTPTGAALNAGKEEVTMASDVTIKDGKVVLTGKISKLAKGKIIPANKFVALGEDDIYFVSGLNDGAITIEVVKSNVGAELLSFELSQPGLYRIGNDNRKAEALRGWNEGEVTAAS